MKTSGNTILVTGGGSGIGRALAQRWHDAGNTVIVTGRTAASLEQSTAGREAMHAMVLDVTDADAIGAFASEVVARFPALNVLVNNAGIMIYEDISAPRDLASAEAMIATNLLGPIRLTDALLGHLSAQPGAAVLMVSSGLASVPLAGAPTYSATKAAIHSYTQSLRWLLQGKVEVIEVAPPGVQTDLTPGQATRDGYMPLEDYANETIEILAQQPSPPEVLVEQVKGLRFAEANATYDQVFAMLNAPFRAG